MRTYNSAHSDSASAVSIITYFNDYYYYYYCFFSVVLYLLLLLLRVCALFWLALFPLCASLCSLSLLCGREQNRERRERETSNKKNDDTNQREPPIAQKNAPADDDCGISPWSWCAALTSTALNPYPWLRAARSDEYSIRCFRTGGEKGRPLAVATPRRNNTVSSFPSHTPRPLRFST